MLPTNFYLVVSTTRVSLARRGNAYLEAVQTDLKELVLHLHLERQTLDHLRLRSPLRRVQLRSRLLLLLQLLLLHLPLLFLPLLPLFLLLPLPLLLLRLLLPPLVPPLLLVLPLPLYLALLRRVRHPRSTVQPLELETQKDLRPITLGMQTERGKAFKNAVSRDAVTKQGGPAA
jgi:hypothetical protein